MNNASDVKDLNLAAILQKIHNEKTISKGLLAARLGLTTMTVNKLVTELCDAGMCVETGDYVSNGGRKAALYRIGSAFGAMISASMRRTEIQFAVHDFSLRCLKKESVPWTPEELTPTMQMISEKFIHYQSEFAQKGIPLIGAAVTIPGRASEQGTILDIPEYPQWNAVELGKRLTSTCGLPVYIDNDANAYALAAKWNGLTGDMQNYIFLDVADGMGAGIMCDNRILYGCSHYGSEIGHVTISPGGLRCRCGRRGCAQAYVSESNVLTTIGQSLGHPVSFEEAIAMYRNGEPTVVEAIEQFAYYLNIIIDNTFFTFDTEAILLQNRFVAALESLAIRLQSSSFEESDLKSKKTFRRRPPVQLMHHAVIRDSAAACILYQKIMDHPSAWIERMAQSKRSPIEK